MPNDPIGSPGADPVAPVLLNSHRRLEVRVDRHGPHAKPAGEQPYKMHTEEKGWIVWSIGPDRFYDIDPELHYDPDVRDPAVGLIPVTYDSSNGTVSGGDIWRIKY